VSRSAVQLCGNAVSWCCDLQSLGGLARTTATTLLSLQLTPPLLRYGADSDRRLLHGRARGARFAHGTASALSSAESVARRALTAALSRARIASGSA